MNNTEKIKIQRENEVKGWNDGRQTERPKETARDKDIEKSRESNTKREK